MSSLGEELAAVIARAEIEARHPALPGFAARSTAIDHLEVQVFDRLAPVEETGALTPELSAVKSQARDLHEQLASRNRALIDELQIRIREHGLRGPPLRRALLDHAGPSSGSGLGYGTLDSLISQLFDAGELGEETRPREPEMVFYQPTPATEVLALIELARITSDQVFCDLGSGLGRVTLMVHLLTRARSFGVEFEPVYIDYARRSAQRLGLTSSKDVFFIPRDARIVGLEGIDVFFLYTPFRGEILQEVLRRLQERAQRRPLTLCTHGDCSFDVARQPWLTRTDSGPIMLETISVFRSR